MSPQRKNNMSVRISSSDQRRLKAIARRLKVKTSDVFRFAVRSALSKLAPLDNENIHGQDLMAMLVDMSGELSQFFDLDADRLDLIINGGVKGPDKKVDRSDIELLAMTRTPQAYAAVVLGNTLGRHIQPDQYSVTLREYLREKYVGNQPGIESPALKESPLSTINTLHE